MMFTLTIWDFIAIILVTVLVHVPTAIAINYYVALYISKKWYGYDPLHPQPKVGDYITIESFNQFGKSEGKVEIPVARVFGGVQNEAIKMELNLEKNNNKKLREKIEKLENDLNGRKT